MRDLQAGLCEQDNYPDTAGVLAIPPGKHEKLGALLRHPLVNLAGLGEQVTPRRQGDVGQRPTVCRDPAFNAVTS